MVTVNPAFRQPEARYLFEQSGAAACFTVSQFRGRGLLHMARELSGQISTLRDVFDIEIRDQLPVAGLSVELPAVAPEAPAQILYSSGTTGVPKGAVLTHRSITNNAREAGIRVTAGHTEGVVWLVTLPLFHLGGCVIAALGTLALGGTLVTLRAFEAGLALQIIEKAGVTVTNLVPTMMLAMLEHPSFADTDVSAVRSIMLGGTTVPAELAQKVSDLGVDVVLAYGQTEAAMVTATKPGDSAEDVIASCGTPLPHVEVRICDPTTGVQCRVGEIGEIQTRGSLTLSGYFRNPEATAAAFAGGGWLRTGDLAHLDDRGYLYIAGRAKDMIIRGGENIYPREIEDLLLAQPAVADVAVVGVPDDYYGEVAVAFVKTGEGAHLDAANLRASLVEKLSGYKIPAHWVFVDSFPRTASGKIQKFALRQAWERGEHLPVPTC
jgi:fatty-acyl-CoA synthase